MMPYVMVEAAILFKLLHIYVGYQTEKFTLLVLPFAVLVQVTVLVR
jgi:hypothetical protein